MKILQVNVRLTEGGAAGVALDLHKRMIKSQNSDMASTFIYGYSKHGLSNPLENDLKAKMISTPLSSLMNLILFKFINTDMLNPGSRVKQELFKLILSVDAIHLHVLHSYYLSTKFILELVRFARSQNKVVVWTLHDHWIVTGRCAFTDGCLEWQHGCGNCQQLDNYPPVYFDRSKKLFENKSEFFHELQSLGVKFVSPSNHLKKDIERRFPSSNIYLINNGMNIETEKCLDSFDDRMEAPPDRIRILIIANDLAYQGKTNSLFINELREKLTDIEFVTVGKNSPFEGKDVTNHGYITDKVDLYKIIRNCSYMLFTSKVDNFPLVIGESLVLGTPVIATKSEAANEVLSLVDGLSVESTDEVTRLINNKAVLNHLYGIDEIDILKKKSLEAFSGTTMLKRYIELYKQS